LSLELLYTKDGSPTILNTELDVTYHSRHGALAESMHIFIANGLWHAQKTFKSDLKVLEIGFGTGLNALLTLIELEEKKIHADYVSIEKHPLGPGIYTQLNYNTAYDKFLQKMHEAEWEKKIQISEYFSLTKHHANAMDFDAGDEFNCVYFDAFAPSTENELWQKEMFEKLFRMMKPGANLVTFCAKGSVKRTMKECGFKVERLPGAPGKREMTRATKDCDF
jgi:tRNA U34 5-methylaminomethyl-2-thiouridine-forming methyltransferase MnmC